MVPRSKLISGLGIRTTYCESFLMKLKNYCANVPSALCVIFCVLRFLYICLSSVNPSFHAAIKEIARVQPRCSLFLRAALSWSLSHYDLNSPVFSLAARVLAFSTTLATSELEAINRLLSSVRECPWIQFLVHTVQPSSGSGAHSAPSLPILALQPCILQVLVYS
jgi:hypothetical protein